MEVYFVMPKNKKFTYRLLTNIVKKDEKNFPGLKDAEIFHFYPSSRENMGVVFPADTRKMEDFLVKQGYNYGALVNDIGNHIIFGYDGEKDSGKNKKIKFIVSSRLIPLNKGNDVVTLKDLNITPVEVMDYGREDHRNLDYNLSVLINAVVTGKTIKEIENSQNNNLSVSTSFRYPHSIVSGEINNPFSKKINKFAALFAELVWRVLKYHDTFGYCVREHFLATTLNKVADDYWEKLNDGVNPISYPVEIQEYKETVNKKIEPVLRSIQVPDSVRDLEKILKNINKEKIEPVVLHIS